MKVLTQSGRAARTYTGQRDIKNADGDVYGYEGKIRDVVLGVVTCGIHRWQNGDTHYHADCMVQGVNITVYDSRTQGVQLSHNALARWVWRHAVPMMRQKAMEVL